MFVRPDKVVNSLFFDLEDEQSGMLIMTPELNVPFCGDV